MKIGELARLTGLSASRIRFYESSGLIQAAVRKANGYRDYPPEAVWLLEMISHAQNAGFSLDEIRHLLPVAPDAWEYDTLLAGLKRKVDEIETLQSRLALNKAQLHVAIDSIESGILNLSCVDKREWIFDRLRKLGLASGSNLRTIHTDGAD